MFYSKQSQEQIEEYRTLLKTLGGLSKLFSDSDKPYLYYRSHERAFVRAFQAEDVSRSDVSSDANKDGLGIGLKTWVGNDIQKVAEFGKAKPQYQHLKGKALVKKIAELRNERIDFTMRTYGLSGMEYSIVKRELGQMLILEHAFEKINVKKISMISGRGGANSLYFTDGNHTYNFLTSKHTLYMDFENLVEVDRLDVPILDDPFEALKITTALYAEPSVEICVLPLYSYKDKQKFVYEKSGLNQWNAGGRQRDYDEVCLPFPKSIQRQYPGFFPDRDTSFTVVLPDKKELSMKVCQDGDKAIMSNPNKALGEWLLRQVLGLKKGELLTYDRLEVLGIDAVIFTKLDDKKYSIDFGLYEDLCDFGGDSLDDGDTN